MYTEASSKEEMAELVIISHVSQTNEYSHCKGTKATIILTAQLKKNKCQQRHIHSIPACVIPARNRRPAGSAKQAESQPHVHLIWTL